VTRRLVVRPEASAHIAEAFSWYQAQRDDLGWELKAELDAAFRLVQQAPEAGPVAYRGLRRMLLNRFPYAVYYTLTPELIEIRALIHDRRHPRHWRSRA